MSLAFGAARVLLLALCLRTCAGFGSFMTSKSPTPSIMPGMDVPSSGGNVAQTLVDLHDAK
jgi:hypothetical protein